MDSIQFPLDKDDSPLNDIAQFANIPGPCIRAEQLHRFIPKSFNASMMLVVEFRNEMLGDQMEYRLADRAMMEGRS